MKSSFLTDGSTDNTISIIKSFNDNRIKIIDGVHRHSPTLNFENALKEAKGDYIFLADQDDVWKDDKVKNYLKWLQTLRLHHQRCRSNR